MTSNKKSNQPSTFLVCISMYIIYLALLTPIFFIGCKNDSKVEEVDETISTQADVHVAFAGGGWLAHTGHSAWIISLLDNNLSKSGTTLDQAFKNVNTVSSNSGGSWFSTMLMYSDSFVADIQAPKAIETWSSTGWIGQQQQHFDNATYTTIFNNTYPCSHHLSSNPNKFEEAEYINCVSKFYTGSSYYWKKVIDQLVFKDFSLGSMKLSDPKQPWATDKSLLLASSLLNNTVVLNKNGSFDQNYYQTCLQNTSNPNNNPVLNGKADASCSAGLPKDVSAVTFTSLADGSTLSALPFFRELNSSSSLYNVGYSANFKLETPPTGKATLQLPLDYSNVPVMTAAASSSAAAGFAASKHVTGSFIASNIADDESISFSFKDSNVAYMDTESMTFDDLVDNKVVRLADGGTVDNSGVAQLVSFLQKNNQADDFNIVAFDNVDSIYSPGGKGADVGIDIGSLFGAPDPFTDTIVINIPFDTTELVLGIDVPDLQIFDAGALKNTPATWSYPEKNGQQVFYTKYAVTTVKNDALGITANSTGTLHAFSFSSINSSILPEKGDADFLIYEDMIHYINESLNATNTNGEREGLNYLKKAMGMTASE